MLTVVEEASKHLKRHISSTQHRLTTLMILNELPAAITEWGAVADHFDSAPDRIELAEGDTENSLATWLKDINPGDTNSIGELLDERQYKIKNSSINFDEFVLYRCSWCGSPSAALRKCAGCGKTRCTFSTPSVNIGLTLSVCI